jgi:hypothetical protein
MKKNQWSYGKTFYTEEQRKGQRKQRKDKS